VVVEGIADVDESMITGDGTLTHWNDN
jgi:cation transport ATPase